MKLTSDDIRQIIKEELDKLLKESREGGFDPNEEIPDAAPEGFKKTYDSSSISTGKADNKCDELLEEIIGLCTAIRYDYDDHAYYTPNSDIWSDKNIKIVNANHPIVLYINHIGRGMSRSWFSHRGAHYLKSKLQEKLWDFFYRSDIIRGCYWYPIIDKTRKQIYGDGSFPLGNSDGAEEKYNKKYFQFTALLAKELRKVQRGEYEEPETGGDIREPEKIRNLAARFQERMARDPNWENEFKQYLQLLKNRSFEELFFVLEGDEIGHEIFSYMLVTMGDELYSRLAHEHWSFPAGHVGVKILERFPTLFSLYKIIY